MNQFFQRSIAAAAAVLALTAGLAAGAAETQSSSMPILMYHDLTQDPNKTSSMTITDERFRLDMEFLESFGYTPLFPSEVEEIGEGKRSLPARPVMITFDDGYLSNYTIAAPILQQTGMKATVALIASHIKDADDTDTSRHSLNWDEVKSIPMTSTTRSTAVQMRRTASTASCAKRAKASHSTLSASGTISRRAFL